MCPLIIALILKVGKKYFFNVFPDAFDAAMFLIYLRYFNVCKNVSRFKCFILQCLLVSYCNPIFFLQCFNQFSYIQCCTNVSLMFRNFQCFRLHSLVVSFIQYFSSTRAIALTSLKFDGNSRVTLVACVDY